MPAANAMLLHETSGARGSEVSSCAGLGRGLESLVALCAAVSAAWRPCAHWERVRRMTSKMSCRTDCSGSLWAAAADWGLLGARSAAAVTMSVR